MSEVFHDIEKKILLFLQKKPEASLEETLKGTGLQEDQARRGIEWLRHKELLKVQHQLEDYVHLGKKGLYYKEKGLPEVQLMQRIVDSPEPISIQVLQNELKGDCNPAIQHAKNDNWIDFKTHTHQIPSGETVTERVIKPSSTYSHHPNAVDSKQKILVTLGTARVPLKNFNKDEQEIINSLNKRPDVIILDQNKSQKIILEVKAKHIDVEASAGGIDVEAKVPQTHIARIHPLKETINEIREIFVSLGFSEVLGNLSQSSFWNFDALFTPQDHPAREMQDTFYIKDMKAGKFASSQQITNVSRAHKLSWRYNWNISEAQRMALRTHTTCVTIKFLANNKPDEARIFSLGRVFRNEKVSYKHLAEFNQVEGVVIGNRVTLRDLMGLQEEFYRRIGLTKIKFWPTFFPYTEPSLQSMVYNDRLGKWIELFGMGIFRPEVTKPLGISKPVLAWGGGIERIAMLKYGVDDVREFYNNNLNWLRSATKCQ